MRPYLGVGTTSPAATTSPDVAGSLGTAEPTDPAGTAAAAESARRVRPQWWAELALLSIGYVLYTLTRDLAPARRQAAFADAAAIRTAEGWLHIAAERQANLWLAMHPALATMADYYYATAHFVAVIVMLVWLYWRRPAIYRRARAVLVAATLTALAVFWLFPVAPPRLLPGYVDTLVVRHTWGSWGTAGVAMLANPYAAMPSLHTAWAAWTAGVIAVAAGRVATRFAAAAYPLLTVAVIVATANHYLLDAVGGLVVLAVATGIIRGTDPFWASAARLASPAWLARAARLAHAASLAGAGWLARAVRLARDARLSGPVWLARAATLARDARLARAAWLAGATWPARAAWLAGAGGQARAARQVGSVRAACLVRADACVRLGTPVRTAASIRAVRVCCRTPPTQPAPLWYHCGRGEPRADAHCEAHTHGCARTG